MIGVEHETDFTFARDDIATLRGSRILISGGTGFVGSWLLELIAWGNRRCAANITLEILSRRPATFVQCRPHLALASFVTLLEDDVRTAEFVGTYDAVVHAATDASTNEVRDAPQRVLDTIVRGGETMLRTAARSGAIPFLLTSSGAVYGKQPLDMLRLVETHTGGPDPLDVTNTYAEGKRFAELQCALATRVAEVRPKIARLFAFVGPYLPLDRHFAIGNFIADALARRPIRIAGDGSPIRTYLYAADMAVWLLAVLVRGIPLRAYNVGSEHAVNLASAASLVARSVGSDRVDIVGHKDIVGVGSRYVPSTERARLELGLTEHVDLATAIRRTIDHHRTTGSSLHRASASV